MSRDSIHNKIDELLGLLSINNNRLSLHVEKISQLDIDVLRKQCIDLYDQINHLALQGKVKRKVIPPVVAAPAVEVEIPKAIEPVIIAPPIYVEPAPQIEKAIPKAAPVESVVKKLKKKTPPKVEEEMMSLFQKFSSKPIASIPKAISVAKRFEFQSVFFDGEAVDYKHFMVCLDDAGDRESAFEIYHDYKNRMEWDNEELKDELKALIYRKYAG